MKGVFSGCAEFARLEPQALPALCRELEAGLAELGRIARGRPRASFDQVVALMRPGLARVYSAPLETMLDPGEMGRLRRLFDTRLRAPTSASGALRVAIERVSIVLRVLEMRVRSIVLGLAPAEVAGLRHALTDDLWYQRIDAESTSDREVDWHALPIELHREWIERLARDWRRLNWYYLHDALKEPIFELLDSRDRLGQWTAEHRTIAVSGRHIANHAWHEVVETLKHEMAHQMVSEHWRLEETAHDGAAFRAACEKLRCLPGATAAAGRIVRLEDSTDPADRIVSKIYKLLRLGASPNQHEAALAMERASALLAKFNLDAHALREKATYSRRWFGPTLVRREEHHTTLAVVLNEHFFVRIIWESSYNALISADGMQMVAIGTKQNLDVAEYVYDFLSRTIEQLWKEHRASQSFRGGRKAQYLAGLTRGFLEKLYSQRQRLVTERALVWKEDSGLRDHVDHIFPRLSSSSSAGVSRSGDYHAGVDDGRKITLRMGVTERATGKGGLLPSADPGQDD